MAYDPELDLLYIGVGNGSPWNHLLRSEGKGDNLFLAAPGLQARRRRAVARAGAAAGSHARPAAAHGVGRHDRARRGRVPVVLRPMPRPRGAVNYGILPDLRYSAALASKETWAAVVLGGVMKANGMASFSEVIDAEEAKAIRAVVIAQTHAALRGAPPQTR